MSPKFSFLTMCSDIGVPISLEENSGLNQVITYLGYDLDSTRMKCRLPKEIVFKTFNSHWNKTS